MRDASARPIPGRRRPYHAACRPSGFTLVELLVVLGIITILVAMLAPALSAARKQAKAIVCRAHLRDTGIWLLVYANDHGGWMFPPGLGTNVPREERWPTKVFVPAVYNPPTLLCPEDEEPAGEHSYLLNRHLSDKGVRYGQTGLVDMGPTEVVVMGKKLTERPDYYLEVGEFDTRVELFRHGLRLGSNYLFLDLHVSNEAPKQRPGLDDPWDVPVSGATSQPATAPAPAG